MSKAPRRTANAALVARMLERPDLVELVRALPAPAVRRAIQQVGLEDAGELAVLLSLDQLREVFDEDLWRAEGPGADERLDTARFVTWLEVLCEAGAGHVADRLAELSEELRFAAFSQLVHVLDAHAIAASAPDEDEANQLDKALDAQLHQELDDFMIVARVERGWDAVRDTLLALDERHPELLRALLDRCWHATREEATRAGGWAEVLRGDEFLLEDARAERETRRSALGYVSPADARAFLALAEEEPPAPGHDPITHAYFRELEEVATEPVGGAPRADAPASNLVALLGESVDDVAAPAKPAAPSSLLHEAMSALANSAPALHRRIVQELAFLANALVAGDRARSWEPREAAAEALERCDRGLRELGGASRRDACALLERWGAVGLFRVATARRGTPR